MDILFPYPYSPVEALTAKITLHRRSVCLHRSAAAQIEADAGPADSRGAFLGRRILKQANMPQPGAGIAPFDNCLVVRVSEEADRLWRSARRTPRGERRGRQTDPPTGIARSPHRGNEL